MYKRQVLQDGFGIATERRPFDTMKIWKESNLRPNKIGSLLSAVAHIVLNTFRTVECVIIELQRIIQFPPEVAPGYNVYVCGHYIEEIGKLESYISTSPWYGMPESV